MNRVHSHVWSKATNSWVVVPEGTKSNSKSGSKKLRGILALLFLSPAAVMAATLPQGGQISIGEGTIVNVGSSQLTIKQISDKLGVNWQSFNIGVDGKVVFEQPGSKSVALNRVLGSDGSSIMGKIESNGQVFIINPNGVIFGKNSQVNVGGLVASTLDVTDSDFQAGNYQFATGSKAGAVINQGTLQASQGGYVALIGKSVRNEGVIAARLGTVAMAAGDAVSMDFTGDGLINLHVGRAAMGALVDNRGLIVADGGSVLMTARAANAITEAVVNNDGIIQAQTLNMRAGKIMLDGGPVDGTGVVTAGGTLDASAPTGGDGGFIETSGKVVTVKGSAVVTTKAAAGTTGEWLIDPTNFTVTAGTAPSTSSGIGSKTLEDALSNSNVTLETSATGSEDGNLTINGAVSWSANTTLTLKAHKSVIINSDVAINGNSGGISINYGLGGDPLSTFQINGGSGTLNLNGGNNTFAINGIAYTVIDDLASLRALSDSPVLNGHYVLGKNLNAQTSSSWNGGLGWDPIGDASNSFTGVFEGLNHRITNLTINRPTEDYVGFFASTNGAKISGLSLTGTVKGNTNVGFLAGRFSNSSLVAYDIGSSSYSISNFTGDVTGSGNVGGVLGQSSGSTLLSVQYTGSVFAGSASNVGGIFGLGASLNGKYLYNAGTINGANNTGGIGGSVSGASKMISIRNLGAVNGGLNVGGLFGSMANSSLDTAWSSGNITANGDRAGGLVGSSTLNQMSRAYSIGNVSAAGRYAGGIIGYDTGGSTVSETFSMSQVAAMDYSGGLIGYANGITLSNSYALGAVSGANSAGLVSGLDNSTLNFVYASGSASSGLVAQSSLGGNTVNEAFWDVSLSGSAGSLYGAGKSNAEMNSAATFSNWGVDLVGNGGGLWRMYEGHGAPLLKFRLGSGQGYTTVKETDKGATYAGRDLTANDLVSLGISNGSGLIFWGSYTPISASQTSGGSAIRDAGVYTLDKMYSDQFGFNLYEAKTTAVTVAKKALTATASGSVSKVYDGTTGISFDGVAGTYAGDDLEITLSGNFDNKNAGSGKSISVSGLVITGAAASNYEITADSSLTGQVSKAVLTLDGTAQDKTYDGSTQAQVNFSDNRIAGDDIGVDFSANFTDKNAGANKLVNITGIGLTGADAANYTWTLNTPTTATINKASLTIGASANSKTYNGSVDATATLTDNRVAGDDLFITSGSASFADKNAGSNKVVSIDGIDVAGADANNYVWNTTAQSSATINKANLAVTAAAKDKVYDGSSSVETVFSDNRIAGDNLSISASGSFADKNAGSGKTVGVSDIQVTGADAQNYVWNDSTTSSATITKAHLDVTAHAADKVYDGSRKAFVTLGDNRITGDQLVITNAGAEFDTKNAGTNKNVTVNGVMVSGADAGNYDWDVQQITSAAISKADLKVAGNHGIKNAGDQDPALAWSILGGTLYGSDTLNGVLVRAAGEGAGIYEVGQGTLSAGGNYNVIYTPGTLEITKSPVTDTTVTDAAIASIARITSEVNGSGTAKASVVDNSGYRLINLGIKLPEDISLLRDENNDS